MQTKILSNFYGATTQSTSAITARYRNCTARHGKALQRVIKSCLVYLWNSRSFAARHLTGPGSSRGPTTSSRTSTCPQCGLFARLPLQECEIKDKKTHKQLLPTGHHAAQQYPATPPYTHSPPLPRTIFNLWHEARRSFKHSGL